MQLQLHPFTIGCCLLLFVVGCRCLFAQYRYWLRFVAYCEWSLFVAIGCRLLLLVSIWFLIAIGCCCRRYFKTPHIVIPDDEGFKSNYPTRLVAITPTPFLGSKMSWPRPWLVMRLRRSSCPLAQIGWHPCPSTNVFPLMPTNS